MDRMDRMETALMVGIMSRRFPEIIANHALKDYHTSKTVSDRRAAFMAETDDHTRWRRLAALFRSTDDIVAAALADNVASTCDTSTYRWEEMARVYEATIDYAHFIYRELLESLALCARRVGERLKTFQLSEKRVDYIEYLVASKKYFDVSSDFDASDFVHAMTLEQRGMVIATVEPMNGSRVTSCWQVLADWNDPGQLPALTLEPFSRRFVWSTY